MSKLAIKGHKTRGKEVIALLEMLGGRNNSVVPYGGAMEDCCYYIDSNQDIAFVDLKICLPLLECEAFTLEEFEEKYPYKVRDKVLYREACKWNVHWIKGMEWKDGEILYKINYGDGFSLTRIKTKDLKPYIEEKDVSSPDKSKVPVLQGQDYSEGRCGYRIPEGFEFDKVEEGEIILKPKKKELPKTYGECCEVLGVNDLPYMVYTWNRNEDVEVVLLEPQVTFLQQLETFRRVITCRDAYWKLAGDWKPNYNGYNGNCDEKYCLRRYGSVFISETTTTYGCVLMFPTAEMRNTFYENFKELIEECKELL